MITKSFSGSIRLKTGGHFINVKCDATSPSAAKKIIQSQYNVKSWAKQMASR
ncbi:hypothetical protein RXV94_03455 [Yeosuana sp. MJ-SS3]|uniref:Uncharacterized protein n=1 Tax=Gilvirhabdus luticola TaxID=3079858 RepID=A0ABU3U457_9FLAO|nr:hypothetical protein [Yeosuana sp. MJ-SS3]MDU8885202.1 hypothetical protein [Yeosuana sp. MJ-SS3]